MKKGPYWVILAAGTVFYWGSALESSCAAPIEPDIAGFGRLPVLLDGRVQPLDSTARNTLLSIRQKSSAPFTEDGKTRKAPAIEWLLELAAKPEMAKGRKIFRIDHPNVKGLLQLDNEEKEFSINQLNQEDNLIRLGREAERIGGKKTNEEELNPYEKQLDKLYQALTSYQRLSRSFRPQQSVDLKGELDQLADEFSTGIKAMRAHEDGLEHDEEKHQAFSGLLSKLVDMGPDRSGVAFAPRLIPPPRSDAKQTGDKREWQSLCASLMESIRASAAVDENPALTIHPVVDAYAGMLSAYASGDGISFNTALKKYQDWLSNNGFSKELSKVDWEVTFNQTAPFYRSQIIYVLAFLLACGGWLTVAKWPNKWAFNLILVAAIIHTLGVLFRMVIQGRPPVVNLYSAAVFVGWGSVILGLILERIYRDGIGNVVASAVGCITLQVAHGLSLDGDTMQMLQAVLDTNFWLATHVVIITIGYSSMFVAGFLGIVYILRGFFTRRFNKQARSSLSRMVYGIVCFATLFSFVGTVLGGIWADQSWGRFWGWDPKENGALLIVMWCAIILHSRWGGLIREQGLMVMSIFGNIVTAWSFFGTNMLGVGLHSYGFMDQAFIWLMIFIVSQLMMMALGMVPSRYWASFQGLAQAK